MKKSIFYIVVLFFGVLFMTACEYDFVERNQIVVPEPDPNNPVSFATQIAPMFTNGNYCTACHDTGGQSPNLETASSYNSLSNGGYINTATPAESTLITLISPNTSGHAWKKFTSSQSALVLLWITEGALNN